MPADAAVPTADGGMLVAEDFAIRYVAPPEPRLLAVALRPETRLPRRELEDHLMATVAARVRVQARRAGRVAATAVADVPAGSSAVVVPNLAPDAYDLRVRAAAGGGVAAARAEVLVGGVLPVGWTRQFVQSRADLFEVFHGDRATTTRCRRIRARRVGCGMYQRRRCVAVASVHMRPDGTIGVGQYGGGHRRRCHIRRG